MYSMTIAPGPWDVRVGDWGEGEWCSREEETKGEDGWDERVGYWGIFSRLIWQDFVWGMVGGSCREGSPIWKRL